MITKNMTRRSQKYHEISSFADIFDWCPFMSTKSMSQWSTHADLKCASVRDFCFNDNCFGKITMYVTMYKDPNRTWGPGQSPNQACVQFMLAKQITVRKPENKNQFHTSYGYGSIPIDTLQYRLLNSRKTPSTARFHDSVCFPSRGPEGFWRHPSKSSRSQISKNCKQEGSHKQCLEEIISRNIIQKGP